MKRTSLGNDTSRCSLLVAATIILACAAVGQGTMVFDQQSSTEARFGGEGLDIQFYQPMGQSFTPSLDGVGFIRLRLGRGSFDQGATVFLNLRTGSITGAVLAATSPVALPVGFIGTVDFLFPDNIVVTPGTVYYFQPMIQSGGPFSVNADVFLYPGGSAFLNGNPVSEDLWFREGIIVPEPSTVGLLAIGAGIFFLRKLR